jgi:hypothetical protein
LNSVSKWYIKITFSFLLGSMTLVIPARWADRIFSLIPPTYKYVRSIFSYSN